MTRGCRDGSLHVREARATLFSERSGGGRRIHLMNALFRKFTQGISRILGSIFGNFSWRPPHWLSRIGAGCAGRAHAHPRLIAPALIAFFLFAGGTAWTWHWYQHRPKPYR